MTYECLWIFGLVQGRIQYRNSIKVGICIPAKGCLMLIPQKVEQRFTSLCRVIADALSHYDQELPMSAQKTLEPESTICHIGWGFLYSSVSVGTVLLCKQSEGKNSPHLTKQNANHQYHYYCSNNTGKLKHLHIHITLKRYLVIQSLLIFS